MGQHNNITHSYINNIITKLHSIMFISFCLYLQVFSTTDFFLSKNWLFPTGNFVYLILKVQTIVWNFGMQQTECYWVLRTLFILLLLLQILSYSTPTTLSWRFIVVRLFYCLNRFIIHHAYPSYIIHKSFFGFPCGPPLVDCCITHNKIIAVGIWEFATNSK